MLPTQPINCGRNWWAPHIDYHMNSRFAWPTVPTPQVAEAAAATGAMAGATNAAAATGAAGAGAMGGGLPPRGPWGYHHHQYYDGYSRYGRRFGRRGRGGRLLWLLVGVGATAWYFKHKERRREYERVVAQGGLPEQQGPWGWHHHHHQYRHQPITPTPTPAPAPVSAPPLDQSGGIPNTFPAADNEKMAWGWKSWKERKLAREEAWKQAQAQAQEKQFQKENDQPLLSSKKTSEAQTSNVSEVPSETSEMNRIKEAVEKLWEEKKRDALVAQETANEKAKEYAKEKLDKLSFALDTLRESLKNDVEKKQRVEETEKKWV
ncbi:uncharacterized protein L201_005099 [Kwoniella dendrophila CBS 6074]|uniref:Peroxin-14 n=1 Tax=Kwoniella dendrophila CBS 6074 TaxID=1295534 RepID=A0AAX4JXK5_9TREE